MRTTSRGELSPRARFAENQALAHFAVNRYLPLLSHSDREDATSAAYIGLWIACNRYRPERGYAFSTFGMRCIFTELCKEGFWKSEQRRQGINFGDKLGAVSMECPISDTDGLTIADTLVDMEADPLALLLLREEVAEKVDTAREQWAKIPRSVKMRLRAEKHESAVELFGEAYKFTLTDEEIGIHKKQLERNREWDRAKKEGRTLPPIKKQNKWMQRAATLTEALPATAAA